jgi:hypothetical protein
MESDYIKERLDTKTWYGEAGSMDCSLYKWLYKQTFLIAGNSLEPKVLF